MDAWNYLGKNWNKKFVMMDMYEVDEWKRYFMLNLGGKQVMNECVESMQMKGLIGNGDDNLLDSEIDYQIENLKKNKAAGIDEIKNEMWLYGGCKVREKLRKGLK